MKSSKVGIFDTAGRAADIADSASHGDRSTDRIVANTVNTAATANIADIEDPHTDHSRVHRAAPEDRG